VTAVVRHVQTAGLDLWLLMTVVVVDTDLLVVDKAPNSALDLILEVQEVSEVVIVAAGVGGAVLAGRVQQIQDSLVGIGCNIVVDCART
jgi:hypothetical protein